MTDSGKTTSLAAWGYSYKKMVIDTKANSYAVRSTALEFRRQETTATMVSLLMAKRQARRRHLFD
jgi:predicted NodU family carbamoyl transferase